MVSYNNRKAYVPFSSKIYMITDKDLIRAKIEKAHIDILYRYMECRAYWINEMWGRRIAILNLKWLCVVIVLIGIIIYLLIK